MACIEASGSTAETSTVPSSFCSTTTLLGSMVPIFVFRVALTSMVVTSAPRTLPPAQAADTASVPGAPMEADRRCAVEITAAVRSGRRASLSSLTAPETLME